MMRIDQYVNINTCRQSETAAKGRVTPVETIARREQEGHAKQVSFPCGRKNDGRRLAARSSVLQRIGGKKRREAPALKYNGRKGGGTDKCGWRHREKVTSGEKKWASR